MVLVEYFEIVNTDGYICCLDNINDVSLLTEITLYNLIAIFKKALGLGIVNVSTFRID
jgi:hypothetical protein